MKHALFIAMGLLVLPLAAEAQVELGIDAGLELNRSGGDNITTFVIPRAMLRIGIPRESITFEALVGINSINDSGGDFTLITFLPGIVYPFGSSHYVRGEVGLLYVSEVLASGAVRSLTQFAFGGAIGTKRQIGDGPVSLRFEGGVDRWQGDGDDSTDFRALIGISVLVN